MDLIKRAEQDGTLTLSPSVTVTVVIKPNQQPHSGHPYAMTFRAVDDYFTLYEETWFSTGAGGSQTRRVGARENRAKNAFPFAFQNAAQLQALCQRNGLSVAALMMKNELQMHSQAALHDYFAHVWAIMQRAVHRGLHTEGLLLARIRCRAGPARSINYWQ